MIFTRIKIVYQRQSVASKILKNIFCWSVVMVLAAGCHKTHNPEEPADKEIDVELSLSFDFAYDGKEEGPITAEQLKNYDLRYVADIYPQDGTAGDVSRLTGTSGAVTPGSNTLTVGTRLKPGHYRMEVWIDFVNKGCSDDLHYCPDNLRMVMITMPYKGCSVARESFSYAGTVEIGEIAGNSSGKGKCCVGLDLVRPSGRYRIVTTDIEKFSSAYRSANGVGGPVPARVKISYRNYFPCGYDVSTGMAHADCFKTGICFTEDVVRVENGKADLSFDNVFICSDQTAVYADMEILDASGRTINRIEGLRIPVERNKETVITGEFLTKDFGGGGAGVDDGFDDEIVVEIP